MGKQALLNRIELPAESTNHDQANITPTLPKVIKGVEHSEMVLSRFESTYHEVRRRP
jgi:hypothetical protein